MSGESLMRLVRRLNVTVKNRTKSAVIAISGVLLPRTSQIFGVKIHCVPIRFLSAPHFLPSKKHAITNR